MKIDLKIIMEDKFSNNYIETEENKLILILYFIVTTKSIHLMPIYTTF